MPAKSEKAIEHRLEYCRKYQERIRSQRAPEQEKAFRDYQRKWLSSNKEKIKRWPSRSSQARADQRCRDRYGMSLEQIESLAAKQSWLCLICSTPLQKTGWMKFVVDHDHKTNIVRGLLCRHCNLALGYVRDRVEICEAMAKYLKGEV